jgi:hypothetical protein
MKKNQENQLHIKQTAFNVKPQNEIIPYSIKAVPREQKQLHIPTYIIPENFSQVEEVDLFQEWPSDDILNVFYFHNIP